jgi:hypothetical protein
MERIELNTLFFLALTLFADKIAVYRSRTGYIVGYTRYVHDIPVFLLGIRHSWTKYRHIVLMPGISYNIPVYHAHTGYIVQHTGIWCADRVHRAANRYFGRTPSCSRIYSVKTNYD